MVSTLFQNAYCITVLLFQNAYCITVLLFQNAYCITVSKYLYMTPLIGTVD